VGRQRGAFLGENGLFGRIFVEKFFENDVSRCATTGYLTTKLKYFL
jgi:hypothetical protein